MQTQIASQYANYAAMRIDTYRHTQNAAIEW